MSAGSWTDDQVEVLKKLWEQGASASMIAAELRAGHSRNAVIGKIHRLGLQRKKKPRKRILSPRSPTTRVPSFNTTKLPRTPRVALGAEETAELPQPEPFEQVVEAPSPAGIQLGGLNDANCHWPIGDVADAGFHFCGGRAVAGKPYCAHHCRISYQPMTPQRVRGMNMSDEERDRRAAQGRRIAAAARAKREAVI